MKTQKLIIPILGMLAILNGTITTQAVVDPLYYQNIQTVEEPVDTTLGESVTTTTPSVVATPSPSPTPSPTPSPSPAPKTSPSPSPAPEIKPEEKVLGVSTEKDHSKEYYEELKAQLLTLEKEQKNLSAQQKNMIPVKIEPVNQIPLLVISLTLAVIALMTEWRYQRVLQTQAEMQPKLSRKTRRRK
jgi:hypothetical protein